MRSPDPVWLGNGVPALGALGPVQPDVVQLAEDLVILEEAGRVRVKGHRADRAPETRRVPRLVTHLGNVICQMCSDDDQDSPLAATGHGWSVRSRGKCCPPGLPPPWCGCCQCCHDPGSCENGAQGEEDGGETGTPPSDPRPPPWPWSLWPSSRLSWWLCSLSGMSLMSLFNIALIWCWTLQSWPRAGDWKVEAAAPHNHRQHRYSESSQSCRHQQPMRRGQSQNQPIAWRRPSGVRASPRLIMALIQRSNQFVWLLIAICIFNQCQNYQQQNLSSSFELRRSLFLINLCVVLKTCSRTCRTGKLCPFPICLWVGWLCFSYDTYDSDSAVGQWQWACWYLLFIV